MMRSYQRATPATPASGYSRLYTKSDGKWYFINSDGVETEIADSVHVLDRVGVITNDAAATGKIGECIQSYTSLTNTPSTGVWGELTTVLLSAGNWMINAHGIFDQNGATWSAARMGIGTVSGDNVTGSEFGRELAYGEWVSSIVTPTRFPMAISPIRVLLSSTQTYYLKMYSAFTTGQPKFAGTISALRVR